MPDDGDRTSQPGPPEKPSPGALGRPQNFLERISNRFHFFVSLPVLTAIGSLFATHFQYVADYQAKVNEIGEIQMKSAETTFTEVATTFATAVTLQQILFFSYRDAIKANKETDDKSLEFKNARAVYEKYAELHTSLLENIDLLARRVEMNLDWASNTNRDAADPGQVGADPISRIKLGAYNFNCDSPKNMPDFDTGYVELRAEDDAGKPRTDMPPLHIDWYSAKHELLTMYVCFEYNHRLLAAARQWAAPSTIDPAAKERFKTRFSDMNESLDGEAFRLHSFLILAARRIEGIRVKFRPSVWYCHMALVRQIVDLYSKKCTPIRTAQLGSMS